MNEKMTRIKGGRCNAAIATAATIAILAVAGAARGADGGELFTKNCRACHGEDGKGNTAMGRKSGIKDLKTSKLTPEEIRNQIKTGKKEPNQGAKMPAFEGKLNEDEIEAIAGFLLELRKK